jgi:hypothetical protein
MSLAGFQPIRRADDLRFESGRNPHALEISQNTGR